MTAQLPIATEVTPMVLKFDPVISMTDEQLFDFCQLNKDFRIERKANGEIAIALVRCFVPQHDKLVLCHSVACFSEGVRSEVVEIRDASFLSMTSYVILRS